MDKKFVYSEIINKVTSAQNIFLATHENPDGDAVASLCAVAEWLTALGKNFYLACADEAEASRPLSSQFLLLKLIQLKTLSPQAKPANSLAPILPEL